MPVSPEAKGGGLFGSHAVRATICAEMLHRSNIPAARAL